MTTSSVPPSLDAPREERFNYGRWLERSGSSGLRWLSAVTSSGLLTFVGWLFTERRAILSQLSLSSMLTHDSDLQKTVQHWLLPVLAAATAACLGLMMLRLPPSRTPTLAPDEEREFSVEIDLSAGDVRRFRASFQTLLFTWTAFYCVLCAVHSFPRASPFGKLLEQGVLDGINNVSATLMIACYVSLGAHERGEPRNGYLVVDDGERTRKLWGAIAGPLVLTLFEMIYVMVVASDARNAIEGLDRLFAFGSGLTCAVAYSLFAGRLDSRVIGAKMRHIVWLYVYAAIQPAWGVFFHLPAVEALVLVFQLLLKGWLFLFVSWLLREDVLLFSVQRTREIRRVLDEERRAFVDRVHGHGRRVSGVTSREPIASPHAAAS